jgi:hypothetical protein
MAQQTPPPYISVKGLYVEDPKHVDVAFAGYDGTASPGQLVVDTADYILYVGNSAGRLNPVCSYGNSNVAAYLPTNTANVGANNIVATGNVTSGNVATGNIVATGNVTTGNIIANGNFSSMGGRFILISATSWVGDGTTVVLTLATVIPQPVFVVGQPIVISNCSEGRLNGTFTVTANGPAANEVTIANPVLGSGTITGTVVEQYYIGGSITTNGIITAGTFVSDGNATIGGSVVASGTSSAYLIQTASLTVSELPVPVVSLTGSRSFVSDATVTTFASIVVGGSTNFVPVYCDGTDWRIG